MSPRSEISYNVGPTGGHEIDKLVHITPITIVYDLQITIYIYINSSIHRIYREASRNFRDPPSYFLIIGAFNSFMAILFHRTWPWSKHVNGGHPTPIGLHNWYIPGMTIPSYEAGAKVFSASWDASKATWLRPGFHKVSESKDFFSTPRICGLKGVCNSSMRSARIARNLEPNCEALELRHGTLLKRLVDGDGLRSIMIIPCISRYLYISIYLYIDISIYRSIYLSIYLHISISMYIYICIGSRGHTQCDATWQTAPLRATSISYLTSFGWMPGYTNITTVLHFFGHRGIVFL